MIRCPQCGAAFPLAEEELHAVCPFCGTVLRPAERGGPTRHLSVPAQAGAAGCRQAVRDLLIRAGLPPAAELEMQIFHLPFLLHRDGTTGPGFTTHVPGLAAFQLPGADWKVFDESRIPPGDVVVPAAEADGAEAVVHYPMARAAIRVNGEDLVIWVDAVHGRTLPGDAAPGATHVGRGVVGRLLAVSGAAFATILLVLPFPWSVAAAAAATPALYGWCLRQVRASA